MKYFISLVWAHPKRVCLFFMSFGFANSQLVLYISSVEKRPIAFCLELLTNVNGFANGQPFLYIEGTNKQVINPLIHWA